MATWTPTLPGGDGPLYERLIGALDGDIRKGALEAGERLPPQRELAFRLGVSIGTVTRAYAEAERRGLITGHVGRGSFVAGHAAPGESGTIDLARNLPPLAPAGRRLAGALAAMARGANLAGLLDYPPPGGFADQRQAGATWLSRVANLEHLNPERIICCAGAQQGTAIALAALCRPGDAVIAEEASFSGIKTLANHMNYRLIPAEMDGEGLTPDGLARAARASGARAAYVLPVQNPTARVMGAQRRRDLAETARKLDLMLVEDDLYAAYATQLGHPPIAALAPERTAYVGGLSKSLAPGLRVGYVIAPPSLHEATLDALRAIAFSAPGLNGMVAAQWIAGGEAFAIFDEVRAEVAARTALARRMLGPALEATPLAASPHLWLPMEELAAERLAGQALRAGVELTSPRTPTLEGAPVRGLRLCLGGPHDLSQLELGLAAVQAALAVPAAGGRHAV
ncbi:MAG: transcriptional regulator, GntR family with aminotransferase domain [Caulobacter sp.]|nr:transcriptional regulator, GntR family with aminotransferase domain [Caulobacter sp.]